MESTLASVHDAYPAPLVTAKVMGQSNQTTTKGANLFDVSKVSSATSNGITMSVEDGCIRLSGTNTAAGVNNIEVVAGLGGKGAIFAAGKYTAAVEGISQASLIIQLKDNTFASLTDAKPSAVIDNRSEQTMTYFLFQIPQGATVNEKVKVWFEKGDKSLKEPYTGGKPSPSPDYPQEITNLNKAELLITGKNLINVSKEAVSDKCATQTNGYKIENGVITFTSISSWGADYIFFNEANVLGVDKLTFSMKATKAIDTSNSNGAKFLCKAFDSEGNEIKVEQGLSTREYEWGYNEYYKAYCQLVPNNTLTITLRPNIAKIRFGVCFSDAQAGTNVEIRDFQIEADSKATTYEPHQSKSTVIDLKGNELCSLPNGVRDEVVIDAEGNVSLIKRVAKYVVPENVYAQDEPNNFGVQLELNAVDGKYLHKQLCPENAKYNSKINWMTVWKEGNSWANLQEFKQWFIGTEFYYGTKNPETIPLGKVELPALPESTSNVWNDGNIPANVYINYLKDVNIAYSDLENQIKQITLALSVMDTPTIIPEI